MVCNRAQVSILRGETICCFTCPLRFSYTCVPVIEEFSPSTVFHSLLWSPSGSCCGLSRQSGPRILLTLGGLWPHLFSNSSGFICQFWCLTDRQAALSAKIWRLTTSLKLVTAASGFHSLKVVAKEWERKSLQIHHTAVW